MPIHIGKFVFWWEWQGFRDWRELPQFHFGDCCWFWFSYGPLLELGWSK